MKIFAFILSLIVVILSIVPCCALADNILHEETVISVQQNADQPDDCSHECSPFYTCGTCGGFMVMPLSTFNSPPPTLVFISLAVTYLQSFENDNFQNIWQPPKLS